MAKENGMKRNLELSKCAPGWALLSHEHEPTLWV